MTNLYSYQNVLLNCNYESDWSINNNNCKVNPSATFVLGFVETSLIVCFLFQDVLTSLTRNAVSRELDSYSQVCEALKILELLLGFLSMTGGDAQMPLVSYLENILKMAQNIDSQILQVSACAPSLSGMTVRFPKHRMDS